MLFGRTAIVVVAIACSASAIPGQYGVRDAKGPFSLLGRATSDHTIPYTPIAACNGSFFMGVEPGSHGCPLLSRSDGGPYNGPTLLNFPSKPDDHFSSLVVARRSQAYYIAQDGSMDTTGYGHGSAATNGIPKTAQQGAFSIAGRNNGAFSFAAAPIGRHHAQHALCSGPGNKWYACSGGSANSKRARAPPAKGFYRLYAAVPGLVFPAGSPGTPGCFGIEVITVARTGEGPTGY